MSIFKLTAFKRVHWIVIRGRNPLVHICYGSVGVIKLNFMVVLNLFFIYFEGIFLMYKCSNIYYFNDFLKCLKLFSCI